MRPRFLLLLALLASPLVGAELPLAQARAERVQQLTTSTGWLTLIGLHWLSAGENAVGAAPDNSVRLTAGPAHFGTVTLAADGKVTITLAAEAAAQVDGQTVRTAELRYLEGGKPTVVSAGTVSFFVIKRAEKIGLRVKDSASARRRDFMGLDYFPTDPSWRIEADWVAFDKPREVKITNMLGQEFPAQVSGKAVFTREGHTFELIPIDEGANEPLFFVISDLTSGEESYAAARFLYAEWPKNGKIMLDFNRAENPPCAFTPFATCPLPPVQNRLPVRVTAGEKNYRGQHD